jgi:flagellar basal body-associated protein FliL
MPDDQKKSNDREKGAREKDKDRDRDKEKDKGAQSAAGGEAKAAGSNRTMFFGLIGGVIILNVIMAIVLINITRPKSPEEKAGKHGADTAKVAEKEGGAEGEFGAVTEKPLEVTLNIAGTDGQRYIKVAMAFAYPAANGKKFANELEKQFYPAYKNILIDILSQMPLEELMKPDAKEKIRKEVLRRANDLMPKKFGQLNEVFIVDFLIQ